MNIKSLLMACAMVALTAICFVTTPGLALAEPPVGSCLGGCLPTARPAPTPVFPADYQCTTNWPFASGTASCLVVEGPESQWTFPGTETHSVHNGKDITRRDRI